MSQSTELAGASGQEIVPVKMKVDDCLKYRFDFRREPLGKSLEAYNEVKNEVMKDGAHIFEERFAFPDETAFYQFSDIAYEKISTEGSGPTKAEKLLQRKFWYLLYAFEGSSGAIAKLYLNSSKHQLMLAFKGSTTIIKDWFFANFVGVVCKFDTRHFSSACTIAEEVRNVIEDLKGRVQLFITGHSLGGYLAQIATYSIKNQRIRDGIFIKILPEDLVIHARTIVFDSPPCLDRLLEYTGCKPYFLTKHIHLDITTIIKEKNIINGLGWRRHLGKILWLEPKEMPTGFWNRVNIGRGHSIINFSEYGWKDSTLTLKEVKSIHDWRVRSNDPSVLPLATFTLKELEHMKMIPFLEFVDRKSHNIKFKMTEVDITIFKEPVNTFVPKVRYLLRDEGRIEKLHREVREKHQQSIEKMIKLFHDEFQTITVDLKLKKSCTDIIDLIEGDGYILHTGDFCEKILLAQIMQNSIGNFLFMSYNKFKKFEDRDAFMEKFWGTLAILVEDGPFEHHTKAKNCTVIIITKNKPENFPMNDEFKELSLHQITPEGRKMAMDFEVDFFGNSVTFRSLCGEKLHEDQIRLMELIKFSVQFEEEVKSTFLTDFYIKQDLSIWNEDNIDPARRKMEDFVTEVKKLVYNKQPVRVLLSAGPGLGKSTYLRVLREELQKVLKDYWVIKINMLDCSDFLNVAPNVQENAEEESTSDSARRRRRGALELIRQHAIPKKCSKLERDVLKKMLKGKKVFLLLDAFDEVCPEYKKRSESILTSLYNHGFSFILSSRPHEIKALQKKRTFSAETYQLREMDEQSQKEFFTKFLTHKLKNSSDSEIEEKTAELQKSLRATKVPDNFWGIPLQALLVARLFAENNFKIENFNNLASLFSKFLDIRLSRDLIENFQMSDSNAKGKQTFIETKKSLQRCLKIAAARRILGGQVVCATTNEDLLQIKDAINGTGIAIVQTIKSHLIIDFSHQSFAEYLAAKYIVENLNENKVAEILHDVLSSIFHRSTRKFFNDIVGQSGNPIMLDEHKESLGNLQKELTDEILQNLVSENLFELYELFKKQINFKFQGQTPDQTDRGEGFPPQKRAKGLIISKLPENHPIRLALNNADERFVQQLIQDADFDFKFVSHKVYLTLVKLTVRRNFFGLTKEIMNNRPDNCPVESSPGSLINTLTESAAQSSQDFDELQDLLLENGCEIADSPMVENQTQ